MFLRRKFYAVCKSDLIEGYRVRVNKLCVIRNEIQPILKNGKFTDQ